MLGNIQEHVEQAEPNLCLVLPWKTIVDRSSSSAKDEDIAVVSRSHVFSGGSGTSDYLTRHLALTSDNSGTNSEMNFTAEFLPTATNYLVCYLDISSNNSILVGGYVKIVRV